MIGPNTRFWNLIHNNKIVGKITSAVYSPRLEQNIALAIIDIDYSNLNQKLIVDDGNSEFNAVVVNKPFYDPNKNLTKS
jgi:aminomethyltransferase